MTPKISRTRGFSERRNNSSILVQDVDQDDLGLGDCWNGRDTTSPSRWRVSFPEKTLGSTTWSSRFTSLSSNVRSAGAALTTRAKQLCVPRSARWSIPRLRKSTIEDLPPEHSLSRAVSMPENAFNNSDIDYGDEPDAEEETNSIPSHSRT